MSAGATLTRGDRSWNPVWEVRTTITEDGWFAEMRIPFSQLRFSRADEQVWGLQLERKIRPQPEETVWAFTPTTDPPGQLTFGHLVGIGGIRPGRRLELLPYVGGSAEYVAVPQSADVGFNNPFRSGSDYFGNAGLDLKVQAHLEPHAGRHRQPRFRASRGGSCRDQPHRLRDPLRRAPPLLRPRAQRSSSSASAPPRSSTPAGSAARRTDRYPARRSTT